MESEWAMPQKVTAENYEAAKDILMTIKRSSVCGETTKTWFLEQEHYCSKFRPIDDELSKRRYEGYLKRIEHLENMIKEYEATGNRAGIKEEIR